MSDQSLGIHRAPVLAILAFLVLSIVLVTAHVTIVHATPAQYGFFKAAYPSSPLSVFPDAGPHNGCLICHPTPAGPKTTPPAQLLTVYGTAYNAAGTHVTQSAAVAALRAIESVNSDDDGPIVTVLKAGDSLTSGTVWSQAGGFSCGSFPCTMSFSTGDSIVLNATTGCGTAFSGWSGGGTPACVGKDSCTVRADNRTEIDLGTLPGSPSSRPTITVTATFNRVLCAILPPPLPLVDLVVTDLTAATAGTIGAPIEVSVTVRNRGTSVAAASRLGFYFSIDPTITTADVASATTCSIPPLAPGEAISCAASVRVPSSLAPGRYRFGAIVDDLGQVEELNEVNNARAADTGPISVFGAGGLPLRASLNKTSYVGG
jgi:hypothetical protein